MFLLVLGGHFGTLPDGHQHGVPIQISTNLGEKLLHISWIVGKKKYCYLNLDESLCIVTFFFSLKFWT